MEGRISFYPENKTGENCKLLLRVLFEGVSFTQGGTLIGNDIMISSGARMPSQINSDGAKKVRMPCF